MNISGEDARKTSRANALGMLWVSSSSTPLLRYGCLSYILIVIGLATVATVIFEVSRPR